jgi:hypothetical protein
MRQRPIRRFRACPEPLEEKQLPSAITVPAAPANVAAGSETVSSAGSAFTLFRITDTAFPLTVHLKPPFQQVLVQARPPVPGQEYNILFLSVRNGTARTFNASDGFRVRLSTSGPAIPASVPILTGQQQWKPGQFIVFYVLTKKYYPVSPKVAGGFTFNFAKGQVAIPGPSGIFLRLHYNPATFASTLDQIVAFGQGAQGGKGSRLGLPDTAIWQFVSAKTRLIPL